MTDKVSAISGHAAHVIARHAVPKQSRGAAGALRLLRYARNDVWGTAKDGIGAGVATGRVHRMKRQYCVYMMTNKRNSVIYAGVTNDLRRRVHEHKEKHVDGFTKRYNVVKLVYYEVFEDIENAIVREKQMKGGSRRRKIELINSMNKDWRDLYDEL